VAIRTKPAVLTERQREVLALVRRGCSNREVGAELGISEDGVKAHLSRLYLRFDVTNRVALLAVADEGADDGPMSPRAPLGALRAIAAEAGRDRVALERSPAAGAFTAQLADVRDALAAVDVALDLVRELPPETSGPVIDVVRRRLAMALAAVDEAQHTADAPRSA
jgi:DNA-binding CsgD family transcriptional regulator